MMLGKLIPSLRSFQLSSGREVKFPYPYIRRSSYIIYIIFFKLLLVTHVKYLLIALDSVKDTNFERHISPDE